MKRLLKVVLVTLMILSAIGAFYGSCLAATPEITNPVPRSTLTSDHQTFNWVTNGAFVAQWQLTAGRSQGAHDIFDTGALPPATLGYTVYGLPTDGGTIHVRLYYKVYLFWLWIDYTYTAVSFEGDPEITFPQPGSTLTKDLQEFTWTGNGNKVDKYQLYAGSSPGTNDIFDYQVGTSTSVVLNGLPSDGRVVYVTLAFWINGVRGETQAIYLAQNTPGFRSDFRGDHDGWYNPSGAGDWEVGAEQYHGYSWRNRDITYLSSCYRCLPDADVDFDDFSYKANIWWIAEPSDYIGLIFRANPYPILSINYNQWYQGYVFAIREDGYYQVLKILDGVYHDLRSWTFHPVINQDWQDNVLEVSASGPVLSFIVNGVLIDTVIDHEYSSGNVGILGLKYESYFFDMWVDYAELTEY